MNLYKEGIKEILKKYEIKPSKGLGQNFLIDEKIIKKIIEAGDIKPNDVVLEIGPGIGNLTKELAKKAKKVITIEKDKRMIEILKEDLKSFDNVEIIQEDILNFKFSISDYKIIANLPYYITSPVIRMFLEVEKKPKEMILMIQKEVAQRICAKPPDMSILAVSVQFYAVPEIISYVSKKCFLPSPKVDSAVIKIVPNFSKLSRDEKFSKLFFKIVKAGFSHPRKQLLNNFSKELNINKTQIENWLLKNNIGPSQRAETLNIDDWIKLSKNI